MTTEATDEIMRLARTFADTQVEHAKAIAAFANDQADYEPIVSLAQTWTDAEKALRTAIEEAVTETNATEALVTAIDGIVEAWEGNKLAGAVGYASAIANEFREG